MVAIPQLPLLRLLPRRRRRRRRPPLLLLLLLLLPLASCTGPCEAPCDDVPDFVPKEFDCKMREFAMNMAREKQLGPPRYDLSAVHEALQLGARCGIDFVPATTQDDVHMADPCPAGGQCLYVDPRSGSDSNGGTLTDPLKTIAAAVAATRKWSKTIPKNVLLRAGNHWLTETLVLTPADSGLRIAGYGHEEAIVSGGVPLTGLEWQSHDKTHGRNIFVADLSSFALNDVPGLRLRGERVVRARYPDGDPERMGKHTSPNGWMEGATNWLPGRSANLSLVMSATQVLVTTPSRGEAYAVYPYYGMGIGGLCNGLFTPNVSFWCNPRNARDGLHGVWNGTGGVVYLPPHIHIHCI